VEDEGMDCMVKMSEHDDDPPNKNTFAAYGKAGARYGNSGSGTSFSYYEKVLRMQAGN